MSRNKETQTGHPVVLYDGDCGLCSHWVSFLLRADRRARFCFAPLQPTDLAQADSVMLRQGDAVYLRSEAVLRTLGLLGFPYSLVTPLRLIPRTWRDTAYDLIARNRHRFFPRPSTCRIPTPEERARLLPS